MPEQGVQDIVNISKIKFEPNGEAYLLKTPLTIKTDKAKL